MSDLNEKDIVDAYASGVSTYEIAAKYETYPNKIRRILKRWGVAIKSRSEAQKQALANGRHEHPTKGKKQSEAVKIKISEKVYSYWSNLSEAGREERVNKSKEQWNNMSDDDKENLRKLASDAVRKAGKEGSKLEKFLLESLTKSGFQVIFHKRGLIVRDDFEVDMFVSDANTAIEIDGPTHFYPIWGEKSLKRHLSADAYKNGLLLRGGFAVLRIKHLNTGLSGKSKRELAERVVTILNDLKTNFPPEDKRFIEIEC